MTGVRFPYTVLRKEHNEKLSQTAYCMLVSQNAPDCSCSRYALWLWLQVGKQEEI